MKPLIITEAEREVLNKNVDVLLEQGELFVRNTVVTIGNRRYLVPFGRTEYAIPLE